MIVPVPASLDALAGEEPRTRDYLAEVARVTRRLAIAGIYNAGSGHPGGSLSCADILACLYGAELSIPKDNHRAPDRDRFVLSKGHAAPALYGVWAAVGFLKADEAVTLRKIGSRMQGHPHVLDVPLAETSTGSLGQGFSVAIGMAMGLRIQNIGARVYTILGDGELQEGEVWEAAMFASHHRIDNLCAFVDYNKLQSDDLNANIMGLEPLAQKWRAFGWHTLEIDGHDIAAILAALEEANRTKTRPTMVIADTVKGKGVPYMEAAPQWHGSVKLTREQTDDALKALGVAPGALEDWIHGRV